jgi:trimeric autotransporter adhesin
MALTKANTRMVDDIVVDSDKNTAIGTSSLSAQTDGTQSTAVGYQALSSSVYAYQNVAVGNDALRDVVGASGLSTGSNNTACGNQALEANTGGENNTAVGAYALLTNTDGYDNNAVGFMSLKMNTTGIKNNAFGMHALYENTTGDGSIAIGHNALRYVDDGDYNVSVGFDSGYSNSNGTASGSYNTYIGYHSGRLVTSGSKNTILGAFDGNQGGTDIRTSDNHIVLSDGDGNPRIVVDDAGLTEIGAGTVTSGSGLLQLRTSDNNRLIETQNGTATDSTYHHYFKNNAGTMVGNIICSSSATTYNTSSDYRLKENVTPLIGALDRLNQLNPSRFNFIADSTNTVDGFLAHEVSGIVPEAITGDKDAVDADGNPEYQSIDQSKLVPLLVAAIQELKVEIDTLKNT